MPSAARQALGLDPDRSATADLGTQLPGKPSPHVGLAYPDVPAEATENLARLWRADLVSVSLQPRCGARCCPGDECDFAVAGCTPDSHSSLSGCRTGRVRLSERDSQLPPACRRPSGPADAPDNPRH
jgi:hypothetical protein